MLTWGTFGRSIYRLLDIWTSNMEGAKKRKDNWSKEEELLLVEEVTKREGVLFGKLDGSQWTAQAKSRSWQEVASIVNSRGRSGNRTLLEVKKKYQKVRQRARSKRSEMVRPPTGGGPPAESPTITEQMILDHMEGRPSMCGIDGGMDTEDNSTMMEATIPTLHLPDHPLSDSTVTLAVNSSEIPTLESVLFNASSTSAKVNLEEQVLQEEMEKIKEMRELIREQIKLAKLQQKLTLLKIQKHDPF